MKVLIATDGSIFSRLAEAALRLLPQANGCEVTVAAVVPSVHLPISGFASLATEAAGERVREMEAEGTIHAQERVDSAVDRLSAAGYKADGTVLDGDVAGALLELSDRSSADLVAVGSRGHGGIQNFLLGSVARKLVSSAKQSVLVAHPFKEMTPEDSLRRIEVKSKARVTVGVDGSPGSMAAMDWLIAGGPNSFEEICAVCAEPLSVIPAGVDPVAFAPMYEYDRERVVAVAKHAKERLVGLAPKVKWASDLGRPVDVLTETAEREQADLLVVGATRHGVIERFLIGSVSYEVAVRAPCSVLVVRPK